MIADARTGPGLWQPPLLKVCQGGRLGGSQLSLELDIDLIVQASVDVLQAVGDGLQLLGCFVVV